MASLLDSMYLIISCNQYNHKKNKICNDYNQYGPSWPNHGEVDMIEMVDLSLENQMSFHTNSSCTLNTTNPNIPFNFTGKCATGNDNCQSIRSINNASFGVPFNEGKGGYMAFEWLAINNGGFRVWFWNRNDANIPSSLLSNNPDPSTFGIPDAAFAFGDWCPYNMFIDNVITINTDFCGWAGQNQEWYNYCPHTGSLNCVNYVAENPQAFVDAYWLINYIKVYQLQ